MEDGIDKKSRASTLLKYSSMNLRAGDRRESSLKGP